MQHSACGGVRDAAFSPSGIVAGRWKTQRLSWESTASPPTCPVTHLFGNASDQSGSGSNSGVCGRRAYAPACCSTSAAMIVKTNARAPIAHTVPLIKSLLCISNRRNLDGSIGGNKAIQSNQKAAFSIWNAGEGETHFDPGKCSRQHQVVEAAQVPDAEDLSLELREAGSKGHVEFFKNEFSELIGIVTRRHQDRCKRVRVFVTTLADNFQTPGAHCSASCFGMAPMPGEDVGQTLFVQHD